MKKIFLQSMFVTMLLLVAGSGFSWASGNTMALFSFHKITKVEASELETAKYKLQVIISYAESINTTGVAKGDQVTLKYTGRRKVKDVKATQQ